MTLAIFIFLTVRFPHRQKTTITDSSIKPIDVPLNEIIVLYTPPPPPVYKPEGTRIYDTLKDCWGKVKISLIINPNGQIIVSKHLEGGDWPLHSKAIEYAKNWRFVPFYRNGEPQFVRTSVTLDYPHPGGTEIKGLHESDPIDIPINKIKLLYKPKTSDWQNDAFPRPPIPRNMLMEADVIFDPSGRAVKIENLTINSFKLKASNGTYYPGNNQDLPPDVASVGFEARSFFTRTKCEPKIVNDYARYIRCRISFKF